MRKFNILGTATVGAIVASAMFGTVGAKAQAQAQAPALPQFKLCTGAADGNYAYSGGQVALQAKGAVTVVQVQTNGSLDNLEKIDNGTCDGGFIQQDALNVYKAQHAASQLSLEIGAPLYDEFFHLICNADSNISKITGLNKDTTLLVGPNGGGSAVTWESFKISDPKRYNVVPTLPVGGLRAISKVKLGGDGASCMIYVTGLKAPSIMEANSVALTAKGTLALIPANDSDLLATKAPGKNGGYLYQKATIPGGTYPGGLQSGLFSGVDTVSVKAIFVVNTAYIDANDAAYTKVLRAVNNALPAIKNRVSPQ